MRFFREGRKSVGSTKVISMSLTAFIISILLLSGPASAITLGITDISSSTPNEGSTVSFLAKVDIHTNDRIPLTNITVNMKNSSGTVVETCTFNLAGINLTSCANFNITRLYGNYNYSAVTGYGYGYGYGYDSSSGINAYINKSFYDYNGYGYSYGYGYDSFSNNIKSGAEETTAEFIYSVTWTTPSVSSDSNYSVQLMAYADDGTNPSVKYYTKADSLDIVVKNVAAPNSSQFSGGGYTANLSVGGQIDLSSIITGHTMTLAGVGDDSVIITMASTPTNYTIAEGATQKVDLDADGVDYDVSVTLNSITGGSASLTVKSISEAISSSDTSSGGSSGTTTYPVSDSQFAEGYTKELKRYYKMKFQVNGSYHLLTLKSLTSSAAVIEITSTPQRATLEIGDLKKFDVTDDGYYDLSVSLDSISSNRAKITIKSLFEKISVDGEEDITSVIDGEVTDEGTTPTPGEKGLGGLIILWILSIAVVIVVLIFVRRKLKRKRKFKR